MNMKHFLMLAALGIIALTANGESVKVNRDVKNFDSIEIRYPGTVYLKQDKAESLTIEGDKTDVDNVIAEVSGGTLKIKSRKADQSWFERLFDFSSYMSDKVTMNISMKTLKNISLAGSVRLNIESPVNADNLTIYCAGSSDMHSSDNMTIANEFSLETAGSASVDLTNMTAKTISIDSAGSSDIRMATGSTESLDVSIKGSGKCDTIGVKAGKVKLECYGSGKIKVNAMDSLESTVRGSGKVIYCGTPKTVEQNVAGSGSIEKINQ